MTIKYNNGRVKRGKRDIIAHRGFALAAPENTLSAIHNSLKLNANYIEVDVRLTRDRVPVIFHDRSLSRIVGNPKAPPLHTLTLKQVKMIDAGSHFSEDYGFESVPTLEEILNLNWHSTGLMLEIKSCPQKPELVVEAVYDVLANALTLPSPLIVGGFSLDTVEKVKHFSYAFDVPSRLIGIAVKQVMLDNFLKRDIRLLAISESLVTPELIKSLNRQRITVWVFTVDNVQSAEYLFSLGVNGIISNNPAVLYP